MSTSPLDFQVHCLPSMNNGYTGFSGTELRKLRSLRSPYGIQRYLDDLPYHLADTAWSPRRVLLEKTAHCLEGAIFAAAALRAMSRKPLARVACSSEFSSAIPAAKLPKSIFASPKISRPSN